MEPISRALKSRASPACARGTARHVALSHEVTRGTSTPRTLVRPDKPRFPGCGLASAPHNTASSGLEPVRRCSRRAITRTASGRFPSSRSSRARAPGVSSNSVTRTSS